MRKNNSINTAQWAETHSKNQRRQFLKCASAMGLVGSSAFVHGLGAKSAIAAQTGGYKALVCINLKGGMDHADTLFPLDPNEFTDLTKVRQELFESYQFQLGDSSRNSDNLLSLDNQSDTSSEGRRFGLPAELTEVSNLFKQGDASIVANVGPLLEPTDRISMASGGLIPSRLYSHNDQQSTWQSLGTEGTRLGWGGSFAEVALTANPTARSLYASITAAGNDVFLASQNTPQFQLPIGQGNENLSILDKRYLIGSNSRFDEARRLLQSFFEQPDPLEQNLMSQDIASLTSRGLKNRAQYQSYLDSVPALTTPFPATKLGSQLAAVAQAISLRNVLNIPRQVFYVTLGGFDTHSSQSADLPEKHTELSMAISAFHKAMVEIDVWDDVTAFTMSDFGRTLSTNGNGTDHGWGAHHFVFGGSVDGGKIVGEVPEPKPDSSRFTERRARMIPTLSVEQYAASLGSWFGLDDEELNILFPNLVRFDPSRLALFTG